jgi:hypothetical protein
MWQGFALGLVFVCCISCATNRDWPPRRIDLPVPLNEASGLVYRAPDSLWWHNDSGDGPVLYRTDLSGQILEQRYLTGARNADWEDLTVDPAGRLYAGDFGNNLGRNTEFRIYRYDLATATLDSLRFRFPGQDGQGRGRPGNFDTEAFFFHRDSLHMFTKGWLNAKDYRTYHYALPATPGTYVAELRDSLDLRRRVVTAAAIDPATGTVAFTTYLFRFWAKFVPLSAASLYTLSDYPTGHYLRGQLRRKRLACILPTQYEAVDFVGEDFLYAATERTPVRRAGAKRIRRQKIRRVVRK